MAEITFNAVYDGSIQPSEHSEVITADHFGLNMSFAWNRIGEDRSWKNFDEIAEELGTETARWPGGADGERYIVPEFDTEGKVVWDLDTVTHEVIGQTRATQSLSGFLEWCNDTGTTPTIIIPTSVFGPHWNGADADWPLDPDFDAFTNGINQPLDPSSPNYANFEAAVKAYVTQVLTAAQDAGNVDIAAFEIGNEYSSFFNAKAYGQIASHMTEFIEDAIQDFKDNPATNPDYDPDPDTLVQIRSNLGSEDGKTHWTFETLEDRVDNMIAQFSPEALELVDGVISHYYYKQHEWSGVEEGTDEILPTSIQYGYDTIDDWFVQVRTLVDVWEDARKEIGMSDEDAELGWYFTEWNVNTKTLLDQSDPGWEEQANYGMKQIAPLLEMFSAMVANGVDGAHIWSARNHGTSVGLGEDHGNGQLQIAGLFMKALQEQTLGKKYVELGVDSQDFDAHFFQDDSDGVLFVSSLKVSDPGSPQEISVDLNSLGVNLDEVTVTIGRFDTSSGAQNDGTFKSAGITYTNVPDYLEGDGNLIWVTTTVPVINGIIQIELGSYEVAYVNLPIPAVNPDPDAVPFGGEVPTVTLNPDGSRTDGTNGDDIIHGDDGNNDIRTKNGDDILRDGGGADTLTGGGGRDIFRLDEDGRNDRINDFEVEAFDGKYERIDLSATDVDAFSDLTFTKSYKGSGEFNYWLISYETNGVIEKIDMRGLDENAVNGGLTEDHFIFSTSTGNGGDTGGGDTGGGTDPDPQPREYINTYDNLNGGRFDGSGDADLIQGSDVYDELRGQNGDDLLIDGDGNDTLVGGNGADYFRFTVAGDRERITDFNHNDGDKIDLSYLGVTAPADINDWVTLDTSWNAKNPGKGRMYLNFDTDGDGVNDTRIQLDWRDEKIDLYDEATGLVTFGVDDFIFA